MDATASPPAPGNATASPPAPGIAGASPPAAPAASPPTAPAASPPAAPAASPPAAPAASPPTAPAAGASLETPSTESAESTSSEEAPSAESTSSRETPSATSRPSRETPAASATSTPGINWALQVSQAGARIRQCGTYLGGWEAYLRRHSEFLSQLAAFAPEGRFPPAVVWLAGACGGIGKALGHVASMVKGASEFCILVGGAIQRLVEKYVQGMGAERQGDVENPSDAPRLVIVNSLEQLEEVLMIWKVTRTAFVVDVDPRVHFTIGNACYERLLEEGEGAVHMIRAATHMKSKRAEYLQARQAAGGQSPPAPGT